MTPDTLRELRRLVERIPPLHSYSQHQKNALALIDAELAKTERETGRHKSHCAVYLQGGEAGPCDCDAELAKPLEVCVWEKHADGITYGVCVGTLTYANPPPNCRRCGKPIEVA